MFAHPIFTIPQLLMIVGTPGQELLRETDVPCRGLGRVQILKATSRVRTILCRKSGEVCGQIRERISVKLSFILGEFWGTFLANLCLVSVGMDSLLAFSIFLFASTWTAFVMSMETVE